MSFLNNVLEQFSHHKSSNQQQQYQQGGYPQGNYYPQGGYAQNDGRPHPPAPWMAEFDQYENRWVYINRETGQRTHEFPQGGYGGYDNRGYGQPMDYQQQGYQGAPMQMQQEQQHKSHAGRNAALAGAAGLAGGALLMHEGEKVEDEWKRDEYRAEERFDDARYDIDNEARRAGNWVEDAPERLAYDAGQDVQRVE
ncbi:hypothetical protein LTS08_005093 [Lithohypha guttulata]|uniref:WW domain-containing protein n=1 Tax=Lithohypha guttulata TaxID=1690604 RepID=A0AAN7T7M2_9EURO|nr:hypothetical protein LTR05_001510 [Lithohypha guttulata]KAK5100344.1 hypothetical protein LTS08_005093 [Lithohypha guttulata]